MLRKSAHSSQSPAPALYPGAMLPGCLAAWLETRGCPAADPGHCRSSPEQHPASPFIAVVGNALGYLHEQVQRGKARLKNKKAEVKQLRKELREARAAARDAVRVSSWLCCPHGIGRIQWVRVCVNNACVCVVCA